VIKAEQDLPGTEGGTGGEGWGEGHGGEMTQTMYTHVNKRIIKKKEKKKKRTWVFWGILHIFYCCAGGSTL
jgi:hypothetical protein